MESSLHNILPGLQSGRRMDVAPQAIWVLGVVVPMTCMAAALEAPTRYCARSSRALHVSKCKFGKACSVERHCCHYILLKSIALICHICRIQGSRQKVVLARGRGFLYGYGRGLSRRQGRASCRRGPAGRRSTAMACWGGAALSAPGT